MTPQRQWAGAAPSAGPGHLFYSRLFFLFILSLGSRPRSSPGPPFFFPVVIIALAPLQNLPHINNADYVSAGSKPSDGGGKIEDKGSKGRWKGAVPEV